MLWQCGQHLLRSLRACGARVFGALLVGAGMLACGPSVQFIYEGNIRFEHCYRLDLDSRIVASHRKACWEDWLARYPRAQTRDRLEYAKRRIDSLAAGDGATLSLHLPELNEPQAASTVTPTAPLPANVHVPPPARVTPAVQAAPLAAPAAANPTTSELPKAGAR